MSIPVLIGIYFCIWSISAKVCIFYNLTDNFIIEIYIMILSLKFSFCKKLMEKQIIQFCVVGSTIIKTKFQQYHEIWPKPWVVCKVLDTDIVYNYTCTTKSINRTTISRTKEAYFQPGVEITNYHVI